MKRALHIQNLSYVDNGKTILEDFTIELAPTEKVALLGRNGSGKSTLIDLIIQSLKPNQGSVRVFDKTFSETKKNVGVLLDDSPSLSSLLKVKEWIAFVQGIYQVSRHRIEALIEALDAGSIQNSLISLLSKGEQKKVGLILALMHRPALLILDEPTAFLDPFMRKKLWRAILEDVDATIFFTTHLWEEAKAHADKVIFISQGKQLNAAEEIESLLSEKRLPGEKKLVFSKAEHPHPLSGPYQYLEYDGHIHLFGNFDAFLNERKDTLFNYSISEKNLEDVYHYLMIEQKT